MTSMAIARTMGSTAALTHHLVSDYLIGSLQIKSLGLVAIQAILLLRFLC